MDDLCKQLHNIFSKDRTNKEIVEAILIALNEYKSKEYDWEKYAIFDTHRYR